MSTHTTLGAVYTKLVENGYAPCSALLPASGVRPHLFEVASHPPGILTRPRKDDIGEDWERRRVVGLVVSGALDAQARAKIEAILEKRGFAGGPVREDSSGNEMHVLRAREYHEIFSRHTRAPPGQTPALILLGVSKAGIITGSVLPLEGTWKNGDLLHVPFAVLPEIADKDVAPLFAEVEDALFEPPPSRPSRVPVHTPGAADHHRPDFVGPRSKRDLLGQESLIAAMGSDAYDALPDEPPDSASATGVRVGVTQDELERAAAANLRAFLATR